MDFGFVFGLVFLLVLMGVVFVFLWKRIVFKTLASTTQRLEDLDQESTKKLEQAKKKLEEAETQAAEILQQAKTEALTMRQEIIVNANAEKEQILQKAKARSEELIDQGESARRALIEEFEKKIAVESIKKASALLETALPDDIQKQVHASLTKKLLDSGITSQKNIDIPKDVKEAKISTAVALTDAEKKSLQKILKDKVGKDFSLHEIVDKNLIAGFMVQIGSLILDGSLRHKIHQKAQGLVNEEDE